MYTRQASLKRAERRLYVHANKADNTFLEFSVTKFLTPKYVLTLQLYLAKWTAKRNLVGINKVSNKKFLSRDD